MNKNKCKTEILTNLWYSLGGQENGVCAENLLRSLNGEREFCVHGSLESKQHRVHVAEVGAKLVNRLGECYRAPADEPEFAAAVMQKLSGVGANLLTERPLNCAMGNCPCRPPCLLPPRCGADARLGRHKPSVARTCRLVRSPDQREPAGSHPIELNLAGNPQAIQETALA